MYPILKAEKLADKIYLMEVKAPRVAKSCQPGEFVIVKIDEAGERIPLTICDYNREEGTITIVFQTVGASSEKMSHLQAGDSFHDFVGPLGNPSEFVKEDLEVLKNKKYLFVAGGVGTAPVYPQVKWLKEHGIDADVIVGAKTKDLLILEKEMEAVAGNLYVTTDDGSYVRKGMVTDVIKDLVQNQGKKYDVRLGAHIEQIRMSLNKGTGDPHDRQLKPDHGRRHRNVRSLPCDRWWRSEVRMCRRTGVRWTCSKLRRGNEASADVQDSRGTRDLKASGRRYPSRRLRTLQRQLIVEEQTWT